jgi:hypothetical protein
LIDLPDGGYKRPMVINATDFQKIKRLTTMGKRITISIQRNNYLSFKCDAGNVFDSELGFGEFADDEEADEEWNICNTCGKGLTDCECVCEDCGEYKSPDYCTCICKKCKGYLRSSCTCSKETSSGMFSAPFHSSNLNKLIKLPGLCTQMQFYAPLIQNYPLKIEVNTGQGGYTLGVIQVFIKDANQLDFEAALANETEVTVTSTKPKGKSKPKKK